jgi:hypothetical protein
MSLSSSISQTITKTLLAKLPSELASKFSLNEEEVKSYLSEFLSAQLGKAKGKAVKNHTGRTSGFILFSNAHRATTVQGLTSDGSFEGKDNKTRLGLTGKSLGAQWNSLSDAQKQEWNVRAKESNTAKAAAASSGGGAPVAEKVADVAPAPVVEVKKVAAKTAAAPKVVKKAPVAEKVAEAPVAETKKVAAKTAAVPVTQVKRVKKN